MGKPIEKRPGFPGCHSSRHDTSCEGRERRPRPSLDPAAHSGSSPATQQATRLGVSKRTESKLELDNDGGRLLPSMLGFVNLMRSLLLSPPDVRFGWSE